MANIALRLPIDRDLVNLMLSCRTTRVAIDHPHSYVWHDRYAESFDLPHGLSTVEVYKKYVSLQSLKVSTQGRQTRNGGIRVLKDHAPAILGLVKGMSAVTSMKNFLIFIDDTFTRWVVIQLALFHLLPTRFDECCTMTRHDVLWIHHVKCAFSRKCYLLSLLWSFRSFH